MTLWLSSILATIHPSSKCTDALGKLEQQHNEPQKNNTGNDLPNVSSFCSFICLLMIPIFITGTLWNTIVCCRGFEDMKDEISSSFKACDIFWVNFFTECATFGLKI